MKRDDGYIALMSTLIIGAVSLTVTLSVLLLGVGSQQSTLAIQDSSRARAAADAGAEEALLQIQSDSSFTGTNVVAVGVEECSYTITSTGSSTRTISTNAIVGNVVRKVSVYVTIGSSSITISSWKEVIN